MVKHNNVLPNQHFHKDWDKNVKTWFHQPIQKKLRREKRKIKAAKQAPRPSSGALKPLVHCPTQKYNAKVRLGRGFTLQELKAAGINPKFAQTIGITVDHRRTNKSDESLELNVARLKSYKEKLIVFPRRQNRAKKGDSTAAEIADAQFITNVNVMPPKDSGIVYAELTDEMKEAKAYGELRQARASARMVGIRAKQAKEKAEAEEK